MASYGQDDGTRQNHGIKLFRLRPCAAVDKAMDAGFSGSTSMLDCATASNYGDLHHKFLQIYAISSHSDRVSLLEDLTALFCSSIRSQCDG